MLSSITEPAKRWLAVTPSDVNHLAQVNKRYPRALFIGNTGDVAVEDDSGNSEVFENVADGTILDVQPIRVLSTGTTATGIIALY